MFLQEHFNPNPHLTPVDCLSILLDTRIWWTLAVPSWNEVERHLPTVLTTIAFSAHAPVPERPCRRDSGSWADWGMESGTNRPVSDVLTWWSMPSLPATMMPVSMVASALSGLASFTSWMPPMTSSCDGVVGEDGRTAVVHDVELSSIRGEAKKLIGWHRSLAEFDALRVPQGIVAMKVKPCGQSVPECAGNGRGEMSKPVESRTTM